MVKPSPEAARTTAPGKHVVLYDGHCKFCIAQCTRLLRWARPGALELADFQDPTVLARFPGISHEACMNAMHLVTPDGCVYRGFEAAVQALATRPVLGRTAHLYYLPGVRQLCDLLYTLVARYRYRIMGKAVAAGECEGGTCALHFTPKTPHAKER